MICPKCGATLGDHVQFCGTCGAKIEIKAANPQPVQPVQYSQPVQPAQPAQYVQPPQSAQYSQPAQAPQQAPAQNSNAVSAAEIANKAKAAGEEALKKADAVADSATEAVKKVIPGINKKILIISAAALLAVIIACVIIFANLVGGGSSPYKMVEHGAYVANNGGELALFIDGKAVTNDLEYKNDSFIYFYNCNALYYGNALYKIDNNKLVEVNSDINDVKSSINLNAVVYTSNDGLYIFKDGKEKLIYDEFNISPSSGFACVSPNGNVVMYVDRPEDDGDYETYIFKGNKPEKLGKNVRPQFVSDDGSVIYAYKYDVEDDGPAVLENTLYYTKNGKIDDLTKIKSDVSNIYPSSDMKKLLFYCDSGTYYFNTSLSEAVKVDSGRITPESPKFVLAFLNDYKSFIGLDGDSIKQFTLKGDTYEKYTIASSVDSYQLSLDGKRLIYRKNDNLYSVNTTSDSMEPVKLAESVVGYSASVDLSKIYIRNDEEELVFSNGKSEKTTKITDDVEAIYVNREGVCCYTKDDVLYTTSGASKGAKVDKLSDVDSASIVVGKAIYVFNDGTLYISTNGKSFTKTNIEN